MIQNKIQHEYYPRPTPGFDFALFSQPGQVGKFLIKYIAKHMSHVCQGKGWNKGTKIVGSRTQHFLTPCDCKPVKCYHQMPLVLSYSHKGIELCWG